MMIDLPTTLAVPECMTDPEPMTWSYTVRASSPVMWQGCPSDVVRAGLIAHWRQQWSAGERLPRECASDAERVLAPESFLPSAVTLLEGIAEHFGLPFAPSSCRAAIARYGAGVGRDWHVDAGPGDTRSERWTVAFSLLLNDPADFIGGDLETQPGGLLDLRAGDVAGFTSRTLHRVHPVVSGERFVLLGFGAFGEEPS